MRLTGKLLQFIHRVFDKDPKSFLALRLSYAGGMTWQVQDGILTTVVTGGPGQNLAVDLSQYTLGTLSPYLSGLSGYSVLYADSSELSLLSAAVLIDGSGNISQSNGDHFYGYTSLLWAYLESMSIELRAAQLQIIEMLKQLNTRNEAGAPSASGEWLDEIGGYYGIPRILGEPDLQYGPRIITEVLRPRGNNVALEAALLEFTGEAATVTDVTEFGPVAPDFDGSDTFNGGIEYDADHLLLYGLFDVVYGYDLINGQDVSDYKTTITAIVNRLRDAGTHFRSLLLLGGAINDSLTPPSDHLGLTAIVGYLPTDTDAGGTDGDLVLSETLNFVYGGLRSYGGEYGYESPHLSSETI